MPWRNTKDPYKIWLSEIILQQTRIEQGLPYYNRFMEDYPTVHDLANANQQDVLKLWEGLGYYSRARNLHATAQHISQDLVGKFPDSYHEILKLKGIGPYTAAAIASFSFEEPVPVIDGNVFRFVSRYFGIKKDIADAKNRKYFEKVLNDVISADNPSDFNQGIMEFGATICTPANPKCAECVFQATCYANSHNKQSSLPIKSKKVKVKEQFIYYIVYEHERHTLMKARTESIWNGLFEFQAITSDKALDDEALFGQVSLVEKGDIQEIVGPVKHLLSHRKLWVHFIHLHLKNQSDLEQLSKEFGLTIYSWEEVLTLPRPKVIVNHLQRAVF